MAPKQQRGEATVERLLAAALEVYATEGRQGFTVTAIVRTGDVSLGSLYHHFGSLDGLAAALHIRCLERLFDETVPALTRSRTARTGVRAFVRAYLRFTEQQRDAAHFLHASAHSGQLDGHAEEIRAVRADRLAPLAEWTTRRIASGELADLSAPLIEVLLLGPVTEVAQRWLSNGDDVDLAEAARLLPARILRALEPDHAHTGPLQPGAPHPDSPQAVPPPAVRPQAVSPQPDEAS